MTLLTDKQETVVGAVRLTGVPTAWASLARVVGIHLDGNRTCQESLIGDHALQFGKGPLGIGHIGFALLRTNSVCLSCLSYGVVFALEYLSNIPDRSGC